ncbi:MAG TPA: hypothetical protein VFK81_21155 [Terriglobales bacterium]|jgi:hypothetical protein|nr:hypothetical protein [Terriglobales bacterium]
MKRIAIATICGVVAGLVCVSIGAIAGVKITPAGFGWAVLNRTLLGFVIGISALRLHWAWHGVLMGAVVGSLFAYSLWLLGGPAWLVPAVLTGSMVFGLGIEFFTTVVFKQPQQLIGATVAQVEEIPRRAAA